MSVKRPERFAAAQSSAHMAMESRAWRVEGMARSNLLEEIVGDIRDGTTSGGSATVEQQTEHTYAASINKRSEPQLSLGSEADRYNTSQLLNARGRQLLNRVISRLYGLA